jgi:hypothetical protein
LNFSNWEVAMHRSSETIGKLAGALALAQRDLQNPEKALSAAILSSNGASRQFRYASLASGLDIIRRALGEQEIAIVQSTTVDPSAGLIRLSTVLAHSSGEWIASDWPICATAEVASPHRMGAALTYARRYALFSLVGIAGEDDLDAPEAGSPSMSALPLKRGTAVSAVLPTDKSSSLRDQLLAELGSLTKPDDLTVWTLRRAVAKDTLQKEDAATIDDEFLKTLGRLEQTSFEPAVPPNTGQPKLAIGPIRKTVRQRHKGHLGFVASQPCIVCKASPCDAHHLKFAQPRALGRKVSDEYTVPLCRAHHQDLHRHGNERAWWANLGLDPLDRAAELWKTTQTDEDGATGRTSHAPTGVPAP